MPEGYLLPTPPAADIDNDPLVQIETYTCYNPTPAQIIAFVTARRSTGSSRWSSTRPRPASRCTRFGALQETGGVYISPACGYPSMQTGIHPTPPHPLKH